MAPHRPGDAAPHVQTSAQPQSSEPDMFGTQPQPPQAGVLMEFSGVLVHDAEVRMKPVGDGQHHLPVLCLDLAPLNGTGRMVHAEQIYTEATIKLARERAAALRKGTRMTLTSPLDGMRVFLPHIRSYDVNADQEVRR